MKCLVCIPSKARPNNIQKYVEPFMNRLGLDYRIFVEPQDIEKYNFENVVQLDANDKGLGYATSFAKNYAEENGYDLVFKIDDDVKGIGQIELDIDRVLDAFKIDKVGAVVFPYSFEWYAKTDKLFTRINKRIQTCYVIRTVLWRPTESVSTFEDFYEYLLIRKDNFDTLYCSKHLIDCAPVGGGSGGLQAFDRSDMALKEINIFKSIDDSIKVISKPDKPWKYEPKFTDKKYKSKPI
tara:strand:+ start:100 stop:813 length:714 start_codon:yes stop_codon:yes gene_type:complete